MRHTHTIPKFGGLPELRTFGCRECGEAVTEVVKVELLARPARALWRNTSRKKSPNRDGSSLVRRFFAERRCGSSSK